MKNVNDILNKTPFFEEKVYANLPLFLKDITAEFSDEREKDIILISSLVTLSGCFSNIKGLYDRSWVHPNLFFLNIAPPGSLKSRMKYSKLLGKTIEDNLTSTHGALQNQFEIELKFWQRTYKRDPQGAGPAPVAPKLPSLFIPGNVSSAAMYKRLLHSDNTGIIFETETDAFTEALGQDWGGQSNVARAAFHHEDLSISRVGDNMLYTIEDPRLSILLSGTPDQVLKLIPSGDNGMMSRFLFYCYSRDIKWKSPKPIHGEKDLKIFFIEASKKVSLIKTFLDSKEYTFSLTDKQFDWLNIFFEKKIGVVAELADHNAAAAIYRLGLITFRLSMILTVLRKMELISEAKELVCIDEDFTIAVRMIETFLKHSMVILTLLPGETKLVATKRGKFYDALPNDEFARQKADDIGKALNIPERTRGYYLEQFVKEGSLQRMATGVYLKTKK